METPDRLEHWVHERTAAGIPLEWPDRAAARRRLDALILKRPRRIWLWAGAAAALCAAVLALPTSRVVAKRLWDQTVLGRIQVLVADYDGAAVGLLSPEMQGPLPEARPVPTLEDASREAGFTPRLPGPGVFEASPSYSVADVTSATLRLRTPAIRFLVAQAGGSPSDVPDAWNGVVLEIRVGPVVIADYDGILLLQSLPFELVKPADFDLELFYRVAFRALGMNEQEAAVLGADLGISPALLTFMPKEDRDLVHEFRTKSGTGVMIEGVYGPLTAVWSGSDRIYALFTAEGTISSELVIQVANAVE